MHLAVFDRHASERCVDAVDAVGQRLQRSFTRIMPLYKLRGGLSTRYGTILDEPISQASVTRPIQQQRFLECPPSWGIGDTRRRLSRPRSSYRGASPNSFLLPPEKAALRVMPNSGAYGELVQESACARLICARACAMWRNKKMRAAPGDCRGNLALLLSPSVLRSAVQHSSWALSRLLRFR